MPVARSFAATAVLAGAVLVAPAGASTAPALGAGTVFNVRDFGATGNGVTDDAPAFRNAIAAADGSADGTVHVPAGTYVVDRMTLNGFGVLDLTGVSDVVIVGDGPSSVIKQRARDWTPVVNPTLLWCQGCDTVSFADLALDGSRGDTGSVGKEQMHGIDVRSSTGVSAERVRFQGMYGDGIRVLGEATTLTENVDIRDCTFLANGRSGISVQGGARLMRFVGNHFEQTSDQDIDFEPTGPNRPPPEDILIEQNTTVRPDALPLSVTIHGKGDAIVTGDRKTKRVRFINNVIDGAVSVFNAEDVVVEGNTITHSGERPVLNVSGVADDTTIRSNTFEYGGGPAPGVVNVARRHPTTSILIELNEIRALAGATGVSFRQDAGPAMIRNNELAGSGGGVGVSIGLPVDDGSTVDRVEVSGNVIQAFGFAAVRVHTVGSTRYETLTICDNTVSDQSVGIKLQLISSASVGEAQVCDNIWRAGVTTPVITNVVTHFRGTGSPEGVISAPAGSEFIRSDETDRLYLKQSGTGSAGWVAT